MDEKVLEALNKSKDELLEKISKDNFGTGNVADDVSTEEIVETSTIDEADNIIKDDPEPITEQKPTTEENNNEEETESEEQIEDNNTTEDTEDTNNDDSTDDKNESESETDDKENKNTIKEEYLDEEILKNKKLKIKWNGVEADIEGEKIKALVQKGIDYDIKKARLSEAQQVYNKLQENGVSQKQLDAFLELQKDPKKLKDFIAANDFQLDDLKDEIYELDPSEIDTVKQTMIEQQSNINPVDTLITSVPPEIDNKLNALTKTVPGLDNYIRSTYQEGNVNKFASIINVAENNILDTVGQKLMNEYINMSSFERQRLETDPMYFENKFNEIYLREGNNNTETGKPAVTNVKPTQDRRIKKSELAEKPARHKPSQQQTGTSKPKTANDILKKYIEMGPEQYQRMMESRGY